MIKLKITLILKELNSVSKYCILQPTWLRSSVSRTLDLLLYRIICSNKVEGWTKDILTQPYVAYIHGLSGRWPYLTDLKIAVYGKRLTARDSFVTESKSWTVKYSSNTIYYKNLKCCTKTPCMTTETLSLMGNNLGHPLLDVRVDIRRLQWGGCDLV